MITYEAKQLVFWIRDSWVGTYRIFAEVVKVNPKTVQIRAQHRNGKTSLHNVKPENLAPRAEGEGRIAHS